MPGTRSEQRLCQRHLAGLNPYLYIFFLTIPSRTFLFLLSSSPPTSCFHSTPLLSLRGSPHPVFTLFQISPGRQLRHVTGALVITAVGSRTHLWGGTRKYLEKNRRRVEEREVSVELCKRVATRSGQTRLWQWHPPSILSEPASGGWRPTFGSPLFFPPPLLSRWLPHFPTSSSSSSFSFFFFWFLLSGVWSTRAVFN